MNKKYAMLFDLDKCIGCYTCVIACKMTYGTKEGVNYNSVTPVEWDEYPNAKQRFMLNLCMHCETPSCEEVCPTGATYKTGEGPVLIDYDKCIGCNYCVQACPYNERHPVKDQSAAFPGSVMQWEEESAQRSDVVEKCLFCSGRVANGDEPACSLHCPGQCRVFGDINDPESKIYKYLSEKNPVKIEGTSVYYLLPEGMDPDFLPKPFKTPAFVSASGITGPVSKAVLGATVAAVGVSAVLGALKGGKDEQ
jgi:molybdopterin-containing oxidoreductase family iron-sulfur binding subunit